MTASTAFQRIKALCKDEGQSEAISYIAHAIFQEHLENTIADRKAAGTNLTSNDEENIRETLLTKQSIANHMRLAEEVLREETEKATKPFKRKETFGTFGMSVLTNIVGNLIYALVVILLFIVAKDQIASWLTSLTQSK